MPNISSSIKPMKSVCSLKPQCWLPPIGLIAVMNIGSYTGKWALESTSSLHTIKIWSSPTAGQWFFDRYIARIRRSPNLFILQWFWRCPDPGNGCEDTPAQRTDYAAIVMHLRTNEFEFWAGTVTFPQGEGALWHQWTPPVLITQYTAENQARMKQPWCIPSTTHLNNYHL